MSYLEGILVAGNALEMGGLMAAVTVSWDVQQREETHVLVWQELLRVDHPVFERFLTLAGVSESTAARWVEEPQVYVSLTGPVRSDLFCLCAHCYAPRVVCEVKGPQAKFNQRADQSIQTAAYRQAFISGEQTGCRCDGDLDLPLFVVLDSQNRSAGQLRFASGDESALDGWVSVTYLDVLNGHCDDESGLREYLLGIRTEENGGLRNWADWEAALRAAGGLAKYRSQ